MASSVRSRRRRWRAHEMLRLRRTHASRRVPPSRVAVVADGVASSSRSLYPRAHPAFSRRFRSIFNYSQRCRHPFSSASLYLHRRQRRVRRKCDWVSSSSRLRAAIQLFSPVSTPILLLVHHHHHHHHRHPKDEETAAFCVLKVACVQRRKRRRKRRVVVHRPRGGSGSDDAAARRRRRLQNRYVVIAPTHRARLL